MNIQISLCLKCRNEILQHPSHINSTSAVFKTGGLFIAAPSDAVQNWYVWFRWPWDHCSLDPMWTLQGGLLSHGESPVITDFNGPCVMLDTGVPPFSKTESYIWNLQICGKVTTSDTVSIQTRPANYGGVPLGTPAAGRSSWLPALITGLGRYLSLKHGALGFWHVLTSKSFRKWYQV